MSGNTLQGTGACPGTVEGVVRCIDDGDGVATAACFARLIRLGERSLVEIWDIQDLSI